MRPEDAPQEPDPIEVPPERTEILSPVKEGELFNIHGEDALASSSEEQRGRCREMAAQIESHPNYSRLRHATLPYHPGYDVDLSHYEKPIPEQFTVETFLDFLKGEADEENHPQLLVSDRELYLKSCIDILNAG